MNAILQELKTKMSYDPATGYFTRLITVSGRGGRKGTIAGSVSNQNGGRMINLTSGSYLAHRLAWLYVHGEMPRGNLDHRNRKKDDNRIANLRLTNHKQNGEDRKLNINNIIGLPGVTWCKTTSKWRAQIRHNNKTIYLGVFTLPQDASAAYEQAASELFTHREPITA